MPPARTHLLLALGGVAALLLLSALLLPLVIRADRFRPEIESRLSDALGMDFRIGGPMRLGLLPRPHLQLADIRIVTSRGDTVATTKRTWLSVAWLPLLRRELRLRHLTMEHTTLTLARDADGTLGAARLQRASGLLAALDGARVTLTDGTIRYVDLGSGETAEFFGLHVDVRRSHFLSQQSPTRIAFGEHFAVRARISCDSVHANGIGGSQLAATITGERGRIDARPITMQLFGGELSGGVQADLTGPVATWSLTCALPEFRIEESLATLGPRRVARGEMAFSAELAMQGMRRSEWLTSMAGEVSLRGRGITLLGTDLDRTLSRFESSQGFDLVDISAVFLAGPLGVAVTKGYDFASLFRGSGGDSRIEHVVSDWTVAGGIARATDVALATAERRIALQGGLDLVQERFEDMRVAAIDEQGCAQVRQAIRGSFAEPEIGKPRILMSLAGPVLGLVRRARRVLPAEPCEPFYRGSVAAPE